MIKHPLALALFLVAIDSLVLWAASHPRTRRYFDIIPSIFWIYFLPMLASTVGLIDAKSPLYTWATAVLLPMSLFILLISVDIKAILRLGPQAILLFLAGGVGIGLGTCAAFALFKPVIGGEFWSGFAALSASWTGGSANMIAVKEALSTPDHVFTPMVIVDTIIPYAWMGILVIAAGHQQAVDRFNRADRRILDQLTRVMSQAAQAPVRITVISVIGIMALAVAGGAGAQALAAQMPVIPNIITTTAWTIIAASTLAIACSFTRLRSLEQHGSTRIGYVLLYFVLTTIGAKASISNIGHAAVLIAAGALIIVIHAAVLFTAARLMRAPLFLAAVASQANVGGVASAPIVAEIYQQGFASCGLLLAILGNIIGTYAGILIGQICRSMA